jgi:hypothetical protein
VLAALLVTVHAAVYSLM